jgi:orotidine-5'-phosphate decarboxylase
VKEMEINFMEMVEERWENGYFVSVGLDVVYDKIPSCVSQGRGVMEPREIIVAFNKAIVESTKDLVCVYKPNWSFYLAYGIEGLHALKETINYIKKAAPNIPVILDVKVGDIDNTNIGYVQGFFSHFGADAITINPYLGQMALQPFLDQKEKGIIILCRTSNKGAGEFQDLLTDEIPLYQHVARNVSEKWNENSNCLLVVGATYPEELAKVRKIIGDMPILIPGVGAQGGDIEKAVLNGQNSKGQGMIINSSRGIIFASKERNFDEVARLETEKLNNSINQYRNQKK